MEILADFIDSKQENRIETLILVELIASQVLALAAYKNFLFSDKIEIDTVVLEICGYPLKNRTEGPMSAASTVQKEAARRVADIVGVKWRDG